MEIMEKGGTVHRGHMAGAGWRRGGRLTEIRSPSEEEKVS